MHSPASEKKFVEDGFGVDRKEVMYNDFVIIGPKNDPIKVSGMTTADAFKKIQNEKEILLVEEIAQNSSKRVKCMGKSKPESS